LAAAQELDGTDDSTLRGTNAGLTAGNLNKVQYQESPAGIQAIHVEFSDSLNGLYQPAYLGYKDAKYARCSHQVSDIQAYLIQLVHGPSTNSVSALAKATTTPSQGTCVLPLGLLPKTGGTASNNYGYQIGDWVELLYGQSPAPGEMGLFNLDNSTNAPETIKEITYGYCDSKIGDPVGTPGTKASIADAWNARFGIYRNNPDWPPAFGMGPDQTGYAYTKNNWPDEANAYDGTPSTDPTGTAANFKTKRLAFASYGNTSTDVGAGDAITGLTLKGAFKTLAIPGINQDGHWRYGEDRRMIAIPVLTFKTDSNNQKKFEIINYACMLMLEPFTCNSNSPTCDPIHLEYRGLANVSASPCTASGVPGGTAGPLVPALVE